MSDPCYWQQDLGAHPQQRRPPLGADAIVDVAIVGAGYSGLWTAYYLKRIDPALRVAILEAEHVGFGASGRNGGWCLGLLAGLDLDAGDDRERAVALRLQRQLFDAVNEVGRVCAREDIDADYRRGGSLRLATAPAFETELRSEVEYWRRHGFGEADLRWLDGDTLRERVRVGGARGALFFEHCAALHPAKLVQGLARAIEAQGTTIFENSRVQGIEAGRLRTAHGSLRAECRVIATEGFTPSLAGHARSLIPIHSMMVATEPLSESTWDEIGLTQRETFGDARRIVTYGQRTADGRVAFGGRGRYYYGSKARTHFDPDDAGFNHVEATLFALLPALRDVAITHRWGGPLGVPRDFRPRVIFDRERGLAQLGGYVGEGVAASNLAGRTLADAILGEESERSASALLSPGFPRWEPEPLRWLAANAVRGLGDALDRRELAGRTPPKLAQRLYARFVPR
ncbi:MAG: FAD-binding oxidoreductase [Myxococcota bacterium]|jgi:glycine/D-amino acid oxidase-like deaminating enzyme